MSEIVSQLDKAIAAHAAWKRRLKSAVDNRQADIDPTTAAADNQCEFGKWLYSNAARLSPTEKGTDYDTIKKLHADFHRCAADTLGKALKGDRAGYESDMSLSGRFTDVSAKLTTAMMNWKKRIGG